MRVYVHVLVYICACMCVYNISILGVYIYCENRLIEDNNMFYSCVNTMCAVL
jgi:hypothetical protein